MFYAANLLSMKANTEISLLFLASTTNNIKRIDKRVKSLDILRVLSTLSDQPFALRLYSYLVVGVVRVYAYKLKTTENELQNLLKNLNYKREKKRRKVVKVGDIGGDSIGREEDRR